MPSPRPAEDPPCPGPPRSEPVGCHLTASAGVESSTNYRQEWYRDQAEDVFWVLDRSARVTVPFGRFHHALRTAESTRLEPGVLDNKYYVRGIGEVAELSVKGPHESLRLVEIIS